MISKERIEEIKKLKEDFAFAGKFVTYPCDIVNDLLEYISQIESELVIGKILVYPENKPEENKEYFCECNITNLENYHEVCYFKKDQEKNEDFWIDSYGNMVNVIAFAEIKK